MSSGRKVSVVEKMIPLNPSPKEQVKIATFTMRILNGSRKLVANVLKYPQKYSLNSIRVDRKRRVVAKNV